jgi:hypothetical protein
MRQPIWQLYGLPHGILRVFNTILYEKEFQNPQIFQQTISLFPEHSTLVGWKMQYRGIDHVQPYLAINSIPKKIYM